VEAKEVSGSKDLMWKQNRWADQRI
jgi:hypothetical protein